jgi:hypothetical protein
MSDALIVRREQHIPAPPAAVFALLTDPEKILRWMGTEAQVDPQPGGLYLVNVTGARRAARSARWCRYTVWPTVSAGRQRCRVEPGRDRLTEQPPNGTLLRRPTPGCPR